MLWFLKQQLSVPTILLATGMFLAGGDGEPEIFNAFPALAGIPMALAVRKRWPDAISSGKLIWALPILAWAYEWNISHGDPAYMLDSSGPTEGLPLVLLTIPAFGSALYSATICLPFDPLRPLGMGNRRA